MNDTEVSSEFPADQVIERIRAAAVNEKVDHRDQPHHGIFQAKFVPEIAADTPALKIRHDQEQNERDGGGAREQPEREHRAGNQFGR